MVAGVALVRLFPQRWGALLGGVVLASVIVCGYALLTKVFPGALNPDEVYARLREPFGYWNAVGLMAAAAGPACLWLGARRSGHAAFSALAYPALGLLFVALLLAYSRGALLALACGCALWFAIVPLRLRGVAVLATSAFCGGLVAFWAFAQNPLSTDNVPLADRASAGHELGIALAAMVLVLLVAGLAIGFATAQRAPSTRRPPPGRASSSLSCWRWCRSPSSARWRCPRAAWAARCPTGGRTSPTRTPRRRSPTRPTGSRPWAASARATGTRR